MYTTDDEFFMTEALNQAHAALDAGQFPVGCVLVYDNGILTTGARKGTSGRAPNEVDHAEMVALRRLSTLPPPADPGGITLFATMEPCLMCYAAALLSGIGRIVYAYEDVMGGGTGCDLTRLTPLYRQREASIVPHVMRRESLALFQRFFRNPDNEYWKESLLAEYTLRQ